jgi:hypothetical protein
LRITKIAHRAGGSRRVSFQAAVAIAVSRNTCANTKYRWCQTTVSTIETPAANASGPTADASTSPSPRRPPTATTTTHATTSTPKTAQHPIRKSNVWVSSRNWLNVPEKTRQVIGGIQ